jgi:hypothetical protein
VYSKRERRVSVVRRGMHQLASGSAIQMVSGKSFLVSAIKIFGGALVLLLLFLLGTGTLGDVIDVVRVFFR